MHIVIPHPRTVQDFFFRARGVEDGRRPAISRRQLVEVASRLEGAPDDLTERHLEALEKGTRPPVGVHLRYFAAAADIPLLDLLAVPPISYLPEVVGQGLGRQDYFKDFCARQGLPITSQVDYRFVVEVREDPGVGR